MQELSLRIIELIAAIPAGQVATYGQIAAMAGNHRAARQVSRVLHTCTSKYQLPWHRVIGAAGKISIPKDQPGYTKQKKKLEEEGVLFGLGDTIDLNQYRWSGHNK
ncbi:MGMT family protein [Marinicella sp. S1101]|uniref:MGMT family protein n=1 Tax=Marinicella marina TaxID=2996016 RepID=UPI002260936A|nr:MGMT family protein [Marinicella marina]MCX7553434.1 MGMT family protein [Marinicella marina]MDJ1140058.1 MGMT family protein [Marinicella marina]